MGNLLYKGHASSADNAADRRRSEHSARPVGGWVGSVPGVYSKDSPQVPLAESNGACPHREVQEENFW